MKVRIKPKTWFGAISLTYVCCGVALGIAFATDSPSWQILTVVAVVALISTVVRHVYTYNDTKKPKR